MGIEGVLLWNFIFIIAKQITLSQPIYTKPVNSQVCYYAICHHIFRIILPFRSKWAARFSLFSTNCSFLHEKCWLQLSTRHISHNHTPWRAVRDSIIKPYQQCCIAVFLHQKYPPQHEKWLTARLHGIKYAPKVTLRSHSSILSIEKRTVMLHNQITCCKHYTKGT